MTDAYTVSLAVELPRDMAEQAEALQAGNPEVLSWIVAYGLTRRAIFAHLSSRFEREIPAKPLETRISMV
jgi:hypothetical protein